MHYPGHVIYATMTLILPDLLRLGGLVCDIRKPEPTTHQVLGNERGHLHRHTHTWSKVHHMMYSSHRLQPDFNGVGRYFISSTDEIGKFMVCFSIDIVEKTTHMFTEAHNYLLALLAALVSFIFI